MIIRMKGKARAGDIKSGKVKLSDTITEIEYITRC